MAALWREFVPDKKYNVDLSERLKGANAASEYAVASVQVDPELKLPNAVRSSTIKPGFTSNEYTVDLISATSGEKSSYKGTQNNTKSCALIFDPATQSFTLERIDTEFAFGQGRTSPGSDDHSEDRVLNALIDQEGAADADDPYDWRHQLRRQRTPTPDLEPFDPLGIDALNTQSPEQKPFKPRPKPRKASTPPEQPTIEVSPSPEPEPDEEPQQEEEEEDSDNGGLQIVMDGAAKPRHRFPRGRFTQRLDAAPISLRSAASSQSPALNNAGDSDESDEDVDEMKLGSPITQRRRDAESEAPAVQEPESPAAQEPEGEAEDADQDDVDMEDEMEAEFATEFAKAIAGEDEEEPVGDGGGAPAAAYDSSSESEEE